MEIVDYYLITIKLTFFTQYIVAVAPSLRWGFKYQKSLLFFFYLNMFLFYKLINNNNVQKYSVMSINNFENIYPGIL